LQEPVEDGILNGPNPLDKERNMMVDDPKWQGESMSTGVLV